MSLTSDKFSDAWRASASAVDPVPLSCALHKLAGEEGDAAVDVCITVKAADQQDFQRSRCACIFLIDNSGSMAQAASRTRASEHGPEYSRLNLVEHAARTAITILGEHDMAAIISFSDNAETCLPLTPMNSEGKALADKALAKIDPDDTTNTWAALQAAWTIARDPALSGFDNVNILLLTDGEPSPRTVPAAGIPSALRDLMCEMPARATISAFGFGYQMNSELLLQIAETGNGAFAYIPDASMDMSLLNSSLPADKLLIDDGVILRVPLGHLQPGQNRSLCLRLKLHAGAEAGFSVQAVALCTGIEHTLVSSSDELASVVAAHGNQQEFTDGMARVSYLSAVKDAIDSAPVRGLNPLTDMRQPLLELAQQLPPASASPYCSALHFDLNASAVGAPNEGELGLALSSNTIFKSWGGHYARSLLRAHQLQQCHNFKDPGVQLYITPTFNNLRDVADCTFCLLPPPRVGRNKPSTAQPGDRERLARLTANPHDSEARNALMQEARDGSSGMHSYMDRYGGCFDGAQFVDMSPGTGPTRVCELKRGDQLANGAFILAVVVMHMPAASRLCVLNRVRISPWHPVSTGNSDWHFPASVTSVVIEPIDFLYNVVLSHQHVITINGLRCITLAHGNTSHPVLSHPFFGTQAVITSLRRLPMTEGGRIHVQHGFVRDGSGLVCGFAETPELQPHHHHRPLSSSSAEAAAAACS